MTNETPRLVRQDLLHYYQQGGHPDELIGLEIELSVLDTKTGQTLPYLGPKGMQAVLECLLNQTDGQAYYVEGILSGLDYADGTMARMETGSALEYCSPPMRSLNQLIEHAVFTIKSWSILLDRMGVALVPCAYAPYTPMSQAQWMPKPYAKFMRRHFSSLGEKGLGGLEIMAHSNSIQTTIDYFSEADLIEKVRAAALLSPLCVGLFANSPIIEGKPTGALSQRSIAWFNADPNRCGMTPIMLQSDLSVESLVEWTYQQPMIYYRNEKGFFDAQGKTFAEAMDTGLPDGRYPTLADWIILLGQIWPDVRVRQTIELRATDNLPWDALFSAPCFWIGLLYDTNARKGVLELLGHYSLEDHQQVYYQAAYQGLAAQYPDRSLQSIAKVVLALARQGLKSYSTSLTHYLNTLDDIAQSGVTYAQQLLMEWEKPELRQPESFVEHYRISPDE